MAQGYPVGLPRCLFWEMVPTGTYAGVVTGQQSTLSNNTASGAYVASKVRTAGFNIAPVADVNIEGGDRIVVTATFGNPKMAAFDITSSDIDTALVQLINGGTPNVANTQYTKFGWNSNRASPKIMGVGVQQRYLQFTGGPQFFLTTIIPKAQVYMRRGQAGFRAAQDVTIRVAPITTDKAPTGQTFGSGSNNLAFDFEEDLSDSYEVISPDPIHIITHRGDGNVLTFNTVYKPLSTGVTLNATVNEMVKNAAPIALTSITLAGVVTVPAHSAGDLHVLMHTTNYVPI